MIRDMAYRIGSSREPSVSEWFRVHTPVRRHEALGDFALETIGERSPRSGGEEASDLSIDVPLAGLHKGVEDAPQDTGLLCGGCWRRRSLVGNERAKILVMCGVAHVYLHRSEFS